MNIGATRVEVAYCEGWDATARAAFRPLKEQTARVRHEAGRRYACPGMKRKHLRLAAIERHFDNVRLQPRQTEPTHRHSRCKHAS